MRIEVLKSKINCVKITQAELHYMGSSTVDEALIGAADMVENEKVQVVNINNGERLKTCVTKDEKNIGEDCLNGPAARKAQGGDVVSIISYTSIDKTNAGSYVPILVFPSVNNLLTA